MGADRYWRTLPEALLSAASLVEFIVLDCEPVDASVEGGGRKKSGAEMAAAGVGKAPPLWEMVVRQWA